MLTLQCLRPEWGEGAIGQDGQVTILDLPKAHVIPYMECIASNPVLCLYNTVSKLPCGTADEISNLTFSQKGKVREYYSCGLGVLF